MARLKLLILISALAGCASVPLSPAASKVQLIGQDSPLLNKCQTLKPLTTVLQEVAPAQVVYEKARNMLINDAAALGADALTITNDVLEEGIKNKITIQGVALKCY